MVSSELRSIFHQSIVKVLVNQRQGWGTGFFVTPKLVVTCGHLFNDDQHDNAYIEYDGRKYAVKINKSLQSDLALLEVMESPARIVCALLDQCNSKISPALKTHDNLYTFGYSDYAEQGEAATYIYEGPSEKFLKFKAGQVRPGFSGAPILNERTGRVCGLIKFTRDLSSDLGGGGIPLTQLYEFNPSIARFNDSWNRRHSQWRDLTPNPQPRNKQTAIALNWLSVFGSDVDSYIETRLHRDISIPLSVETKFEQVKPPWTERTGLFTQANYKLPDEQTLFDVLESKPIEGQMLILGAAGSGKSLVLRQIAKVLIDRCKMSPDNGSIPVLLDIASWNISQHKSFESFVVSELGNKPIPANILSAWIKGSKISFLVDGFDETPIGTKQKYTDAINDFLTSRKFKHFVVCSRSGTFHGKKKLRLRVAICLSVLSEHQLESYFVNLHEMELWRKLQKMPVLKKMIANPLFLHLTIKHYLNDQSIEVLENRTGEVAAINEVLNSFLEKKIDYLLESTFAHLGNTRAKRKQLYRWLIWIAKDMSFRSNTFFRVDRLQASSLDRDDKKIFNSIVLAICMVTGFSVSGIAGVIIACFFAFSSKRIRRVETLKLPSIKDFRNQLERAGVLEHLFSGIAAGISSLSSNLKLPQLQSLAANSKESVGRFQENFQFANHWFRTIVPNIQLFSRTLSSSLNSIIGIIFNSALWLLGVVLNMLFPIHRIFKAMISGSQGPSISRNKRIQSNEGIRRATRNSFIYTAIFGTIGSLFLLFLHHFDSNTIGFSILIGKPLFWGLIPNMLNVSYEESTSLFVIIRGFCIFGLIGGLFPGIACIQHFALRVVLCFKIRCMPWDCDKLLEQFCSVNILQKVNGVYKFYHQSLQDYCSQKILIL